jgi:hypothetical protein
MICAHSDLDKRIQCPPSHRFVTLLLRGAPVPLLPFTLFSGTGSFDRPLALRVLRRLRMTAKIFGVGAKCEIRN